MSRLGQPLLILRRNDTRRHHTKFTDQVIGVLRAPQTATPCSFGLSATSQQYFSLRTNRNQQYFSLGTNQHQPSATSQTNCGAWLALVRFLRPTLLPDGTCELAIMMGRPPAAAGEPDPASYSSVASVEVWLSVRFSVSQPTSCCRMFRSANDFAGCCCHFSMGGIGQRLTDGRMDV
jgi:hypothetical protein